MAAMANQKTTLNDSPRESQIRNYQANIALALTVALVSPLASMGKPCQAADFRHAKKIIVPASNIPRRYDYSSSGGRESSPPSGYESDSSYGAGNQNQSYGGMSSTSTSGSSKVSKYGLVPPPPPVTPSLLPSSMASDVPPPPHAPSLVSRPAPASANARHSAGNFQQTSGDPTRSNTLTRHVVNAKANKIGAESAIISQITAQADALAKEGKLQEAQDLLEKYEKNYPKNMTLDHKLSEVSLERAKYYIRKDDYVEAGKQARIALHHNSSNTEAKNALEQVLRHHGVDPNHAVSRVKMGDMLFSQGKLKEARVEYDSALKIHHSGEAYIGLGNVALRENKLKEAKSHYQLALEKEPESSVALRQLGIVRYKLKDVVGANADLSRALVLNHEDKHAGQTLIELWQRQVSMRPNDASSHLGLARAHQLAGDLKSAQNSYRTVVSIDANHPNLPAARQSFKLALARQEAQKTYDAAKTLDASGALPEAYTKAGESVSLSPGDVKFRHYQADLAERLGNYPDAKQLYIEILRQDPKNLVAAQKIKSLSELLSAGDTAQSLRGPLNSAQGLQAQAGSLGAPLAMPADQGATGGSITGLPRLRGEGPALSTLPGAPGAKPPSADPVNSMSGFLGDLRNFMVVQKKELQKQEDNVMEAVGHKAKSDKSSSLAALDLPPLSSSSSADTALPKNLISSDDVQKLLASTGTGSSSSALGSAASSAPMTMPPLDGVPIGSLASRLPAGLSSQDIGRILGSQGISGLSPGMSGLAAANPPSSMGSNNSSYAPQYNSGNSSVGDSILSSPRDSETVLKVANAPLSDMPPVAPPRYGSAPGGISAMPQSNAYSSAPASEYAPQSAPPIGAAPRFSPELVGLAAQAQSLSPEALAGIARSLGMEPAHVSALAAQALQQAPHLINAAPGMINKGIAHIKQEDIDKMATLLKHHVAMRQQAAGIVPKGTASDIVTTKATPELIKKVDLKNTGTASKLASAKTGIHTTAKTIASKTGTKTVASKTTSAKTASASNSLSSGQPANAASVASAENFTQNNSGASAGYNENSLRAATRSPQNFTSGQNSSVVPLGLAAAPLGLAALPQAFNQGARASEAPQSFNNGTQTSAAPQNFNSDSQRDLQSYNEAPQVSSAPSLGSTSSTEFTPLFSDFIGERSSSNLLPAPHHGHAHRLNHLEAQNKTLLSQLDETKKQLDELRESVVTKPTKESKATRKKLKASKSSTKGSNAATNSGSTSVEPMMENSSPPVSGQAYPSTSPANNPVALASNYPANSASSNAFAPQAFAPSAAMSALANTAPSTVPAGLDSFINLELSGINVRPKGVRLNVVLRNGTNQDLELPSKTKAIVRMVGAPDQVADVSFPVKAITPGQEAKGYISVSGHKLDPSADVFIPKLMNTEAGQRDVHLTVPISALSNMPH